MNHTLINGRKSVLREAAGGTAVKDLCRRAGISAVTFYKWKAKYENMEVSEMRRLRLLEEENARLKKIVAQPALDIDALSLFFLNHYSRQCAYAGSRFLFPGGTVAITGAMPAGSLISM